MAESSWPGPAPATVTEHDHELLMSAAYFSGLVGDPSLSSLVFGDSSGMQVKVRANRHARVRGQMWTSGPTDLTAPIGINASGSTRIDRVVLRLDRATWLVTVEVLEGTPGSGGPALTQNPGPAGVWELLLANVTVANNANTITAADVDARNTYLGAQLIVANSGDLIAEDAPLAMHFLRYQPNQDILELHTQGTALAGRRLLWSDSGEVALDGSNSRWTATGSSVIRRVGNVVHLRYAGADRRGDDLSNGANSPLPGTVPALMRPPANLGVIARLSGSPNAGQAVHVAVQASGAILLTQHNGVQTSNGISGFTVTWLVVD